MSIKKIIEEQERKFDEEFGIAGEDKNCDSEGRRAGCDDCSINIEEREEHKLFLKSSHQAILDEVEREIKAIWNYPCSCDRKQLTCVHNYELMHSILQELTIKEDE